MELKVLDQTVNINLDTTKRTGVMLSGGMDSAILLFLILKEIEDKKLTLDLTAYNVPNVNDNADNYSRRVIQFLESYFQKQINFSNIGTGIDYPLNLINKPARSLLASGLVDILYSGQNQFPSEAKDWPAYKYADGQFIRRDPSLPDPPNVRYPFIHLYKYHILDIYRQFNLLDLAAITHSCTVRKDGYCNECLWCIERAWAFTKLGIVDRAVMPT